MIKAVVYWGGDGCCESTPGTEPVKFKKDKPMSALFSLMNHVSQCNKRHVLLHDVKCDLCGEIKPNLGLSGKDGLNEHMTCYECIQNTGEILCNFNGAWSEGAKSSAGAG
jgi:hypothetical protein